MASCDDNNEEVMTSFENLSFCYTLESISVRDLFGSPGLKSGIAQLSCALRAHWTSPHLPERCPSRVGHPVDRTLLLLPQSNVMRVPLSNGASAPIAHPAPPSSPHSAK
jgi:hypothetical protein